MFRVLLFGIFDRQNCVPDFGLEHVRCVSLVAHLRGCHGRFDFLFYSRRFGCVAPAYSCL